MAEELVIPSNDECRKLLKYARHTAIASDRICATLLAFSNRLEELNIIPKDRETKKLRDRHLRKDKQSTEIPNEKIEEMVSKFKSHPDAESIVSSLFRDTSVRRVKTLMSKIATNEEEKKDNSEEEEAD